MIETIEIPIALAHFRLPEAVHERLQFLLDQQQSGKTLTPLEYKEAEGLVQLAEFLTLLDLRAMRIAQEQPL